MNTKSFLHKTLLTVCLALTSLTSIAQGVTNDIEMADTLRSSGKIYVVVTVLSVIFIGIVFYLVKLDRRISKLEKNK